MLAEHQPRGEHCVCLVAQLHPTLCDPVDCSPPGSSVHGDSPGSNTEVSCRALLQENFPAQGSNPGLLRCRKILYHLSHQRSRWWALTCILRGQDGDPRRPWTYHVSHSFSSPHRGLAIPWIHLAVAGPFQSLLLSFLLPSFPFLFTTHTSDFSVTASYPHYVPQYLMSNIPTGRWISHWS